MDKLKKKVILTTVIFIIVTVSTTTGFSLYYMFGKMKDNTDKFLLESARSYGLEINGFVIGIEKTVDALAKSIVSNIDRNQIDNPVYYETLYPFLDNLANAFKNNTLNATSFYVRFDPELTHGTSGVFYVDTNQDGFLEKYPPTDITLYQKTDRERVAWFYEPLEAQKPIWTKPYYNANVQADMISYVSPLTIDNKTIGVIGIDVNFDRLREICKTQDGFGQIILLDKDLSFLVHESYSMNETLRTIDNGDLSALADRLSLASQGIESYTLDQVKKILGYSVIDNGWTVVIAMTKAEAFTDLNRTLFILIVFNTFVTALILILSIFIVRFLHKLYTKNETLESLVYMRTIELENSLHSLNATQEKLIVTEKMASLGNIVTGIAHEINTPLGNGITVLSHLKNRMKELEAQLVEKKLSFHYMNRFQKEENEALELLESSFMRIKNLVDTFKLLSDFDAVNSIDEIEMASFLEAFIRTIPNVEPFTISIYCRSSLNVYTSPEVLKEILRHLIKNAIYHGYENSKHGVIVIKVEKEVKEVVITISDTGKGVTDSNLQNIFEPFYTTKRNKGFVGLGLHLVYNLVTQVLNGDIKVMSNTPSGLRYVIRFPEAIANDKE